MGLSIFNKFGWELTQREIQAAHRVANAFGRNRGVVNLVDNQTKVNVQYLSYKGVVFTEPRLEYFYSASLSDIFKPRILPDDKYLDELEAGKLPDVVRYFIKKMHPISAYLSSPGVTIEVIETVLQTSTTADTSHQKIKRVVKVSYQIPPESKTSDSRDFSKTYRGTATVDTQFHSSINGYFAVSYAGTFENWPAIDESGRARLINSLATRVPVPTDYIGDDHGVAFSHYANDFPYPEEFSLLEDNPSQLTQGDGFGVILNGDVVGMVEFDVMQYDPQTGLDLLGAPFDPPLPTEETDNVTRNHPDILIGKSEYNFRYLPRTYSEETTDNDRTFLDSSLRDNQIVIVYPVQFTSETYGDLGLFPSDEEKANITGVVLTKGYAFKYSYEDATFSFIKSLDIVDKRTGATAERIELAVAPTSDWPNCLFKSCRYPTGWKDVDNVYREQEKSLTGVFGEANLTVEGLYDFIR